MKTTFSIVSFLFFCLSLPATSIGDGGYLELGTVRKTARTIVVCPVGSEYDNGIALLDALSSIVASGEENPYQLKLEPGIYNVGSTSLEMKSYVDIEGSGELVTKIKGEIGANDRGVVIGATFAELRFLSVENVGDGSAGVDSIGVYNNLASPRLTHVTVTARDGDRNSIAVYCIGLSKFVIADAAINAHDPVNGHCIGIYIQTLVELILKNSTINISGDNDNYGVFSEKLCIPSIDNSKIEVTGGNDAFGVYNGENSVAIIQNSYIEVELASRWMYGVLNNHSGARVTIRNTYLEAEKAVMNANIGGNVEIDRSTLKGTGTSARNDNPSADFLIGATKLDGATTANLTCAGAYDVDYKLLDNACMPISP